MSNSYYDGTAYKYIGSGAAARQYYNTDGTMHFYNASSGTAGGTVTWNERMRITSSSECHVELSGTAPIIKATAGNGASGLRINIAGQTSGQLFRIQEDGATKFQINENGNVGIGTTSPSARLNVYGTGTANDPTLAIDTTSSSVFNHAIEAFNGNLTANEGNYIFVGKEGSLKNTGYIGYKYSGTSGSNANILTFGHWASDNLMNLTGDGNLGIGTESPSEIFHVNKNATSRIVGAYLTNSQANTGAEAVSIAFGLNRSGGDFVRKVEAIEFGATEQWTGTPSTVNSYLAFNVVKSETMYERMRVTTDGVDVTSSGAHGVHLKPDTADTNNSGRLILTRIGGSGWAVMNNATNFSIRSGATPGSTSGTEKIRLTGYSATSWTSGSDETMKENIISIGNVLDKIQNYRCVEYNFIDDEATDKKIGFIAQDWQEDFPQIIEQMENEKIGMKYTETIPILLKAIQELKADNDNLRERIQTLENQ